MFPCTLEVLSSSLIHWTCFLCSSTWSCCLTWSLVIVKWCHYVCLCRLSTRFSVLIAHDISLVFSSMSAIILVLWKSIACAFLYSILTFFSSNVNYPVGMTLSISRWNFIYPLTFEVDSDFYFIAVNLTRPFHRQPWHQCVYLLISKNCKTYLS